jgi:hypothetical protein
VLTCNLLSGVPRIRACRSNIRPANLAACSVPGNDSDRSEVFTNRDDRVKAVPSYRGNPPSVIVITITTLPVMSIAVAFFVRGIHNIPTEDVGRSVPDGVHNCAAVRLSSGRSRWLRCRVAMPDKPIGAVGVVPRWHDSIENRMPAGIEFRESSCYAPADERIAVVEGLRTPLGSRRQGSVATLEA